MRLIILMFVMAAPAVHAAEVSYSDLCTYDKMCTYVRNADGTFIKPKPAILETVRILRDPIKEVGQKLGVDSRAIAGAILAENTLNVQIDDDIQNFLVRTRLTPSASVFGKTFTIGLGQINLEAAMEVEPLLAKIESRPPATSTQVAQELLTPLGAIRYAGAILRKAQDDYAKAGIDISKNPEILVSLYNLGNTAQRARAAARSKTFPRPNYFGFFIQQNLKEIGDTLEWDKPPRPSQLGSNAEALTERTLSAKVPITTSPPLCNTEGAGNAGEFNKMFSRSEGREIGQVSGKYVVLSRGLDCDLQGWTLIRTARNSIGWVKDDELEKVSSVKPVSEVTRSCQDKPDADCERELKNRLGRDLLEVNDHGLLEVKLVGDKKNPHTVNFKKFTLECLIEKRKYPDGHSSAEGRLVNHEEYTAIQEKLTQKRNQALAQLGLGNDDWYKRENIYNSLHSLNSNHDPYICKNGCRLTNEDALNLYLNADFSKPLSYKQFSELSGAYFYFERLNPTDDKKGDLEDPLYGENLVQRIERQCKRSMEVSSDLKDAFRRQREIIKKQKNKADKVAETWENIILVCQMVQAPSGNNETEAGFCDECYVPLISRFSGTNSISSITIRNLKNFLKTDQDIRDYFDSVVQIKLSNEEFSCEYDPLASAERVKNLLNHPCVEAAFVPERYLLAAAKVKGKQTMFMNFLSEDRFAVQVKNSCRGWWFR